MYRDTRFGELMKALSRKVFDNSVEKFESDKYRKSFSSWNHLLTMIYAHLSGSRSLREVEVGFNAHKESLYHLGVREVKKSTLADANASRSPEVFADICAVLMQQTHRKLRRELKDFLYLLDSSPISLKGAGYDEWTLDNTNHRTQGLKLHMLYSADAATPLFAEMTAPNVNDIEIGRSINLEEGATYVFDKGYCDYNWWHKIQENKAFFVTRFKNNAAIEAVSSLPIARDSIDFILEDSIVKFTNKRPGGHRRNQYGDTPLRRIVVSRPDKGRPLVIATNDFERSANEIAEFYKRRWEIELFFKWLKQNLKIKKFLGRSENAVKTQILTAIICYLLVLIYKTQAGIKDSLALVVATLKTSLFQRTETEYMVLKRRKKRKDELKSLQMELALC